MVPQHLIELLNFPATTMPHRAAFNSQLTFRLASIIFPISLLSFSPKSIALEQSEHLMMKA
jgi:hypothetical protein